MALLSDRDLLRRVPLFPSLTESRSHALENAFSKRRFDRNTLIVQQGERSEAFLVILVGRAHVITQGDRGREVIFAVLEQGDHFGEASVIDRLPHSASVRAAVPTEVLMLERDAFNACLPERGSLPHGVMLTLVQRLRAADRKIESLALLNVEERIVHFLREIAHVDPDGHMIIHERVSAGDVGRNVGASREMATRVIKRMKDEGMIVVRPDGSHLMPWAMDITPPRRTATPR
jgi:CRP-like cAMP-binding protein